MPIYEYQCGDCRKQFSLLILAPSAGAAPACPKCGSANLERLMSRFGTVTSDQKRMERLSDPSSFSGLDENDPGSVARWAKRMGKEMGDEAGEGFDEMVDQAVEDDGRSKERQNDDDPS
jgi:putative FmdB family regulatory protein